MLAGMMRSGILQIQLGILLWVIKVVRISTGPELKESCDRGHLRVHLSPEHIKPELPHGRSYFGPIRVALRA